MYGADLFAHARLIPEKIQKYNQVIYQYQGTLIIGNISIYVGK